MADVACECVEIARKGYQIQLPSCREAGFTLDDTVPVVVGLGILVIHDGSGSRLADDLVAIRDE